MSRRNRTRLPRPYPPGGPTASRGWSRRDLLRLGGAGLGALALSGLPATGCEGGGGDDTFRFAVLADPHIIDEAYTGPESNAEDTESMAHTEERLRAARAQLNAIRPAVEQVFVCGDVVHNYPSTDWDYYFENRTRWDIAKDLLDGFEAPVHIGLGNHDYDLDNIPRDFTHELFQEKFGIEPYYAVEHRGFAFVHLNNFLGETCNSDSAAYNPESGSLGAEQLDWLEAELARGRPTFVFLHFPLVSMEKAEVGSRDLTGLLKDHRDTIQRVISGHWHLWMDYGTNYGPQHMLCASTRFDEDAFLVIEANPAAGTHRILNRDLIEWYSHDTEPYVEVT